MSELVSKHYDNRYFDWQSSIGEFGGWANQSKFINYISIRSKVLNFGCGGGFLLKNLNVAKKVGVEVNIVAADAAKKNGIEVFRSVAEVPDDYVDVIISNNALEHTLQPLEELKMLLKKLQVGGKIIFVVPCESIGFSYKPGDINYHLYSWSPMSIGNLFTEAGYQVIESKPYIHKWPRIKYIWPSMYKSIAKVGSRKIFEVSCRIYGRIARQWFQVRVIAEKKKT